MVSDVMSAPSVDVVIHSMPTMASLTHMTMDHHILPAR